MKLHTRKPVPPSQPDSGPGGKEYRHKNVSMQSYGSGSFQYWVFRPEDPEPEKPPVVMLAHGWGGINPALYGEWIEHIVRRGMCVVYPRYQEDLSTPTSEFTRNTMHALEHAFAQLENIQADTFAAVGHSAGGQIAANVAVLSEEYSVPAPKALMCVQPGKSQPVAKKVGIPLIDLSRIPAQTLLLTVVGDRDWIVKDTDAKKIFSGAETVLPGNKNMIIINSDEYGKPHLIADHFTALCFNRKYNARDAKEQSDNARERIRRQFMERLEQEQIQKSELPDFEKGEFTADALNYYGLWKLFDGLCDAAFYGKNREYALGNTKEQKYMGTWSDGTPVKELSVIG